MSILADLAAQLNDGTVEVIDLTAPLSEDTSVIRLPEDRGQPWPFQREIISCYDDAGPEVYWHNIKMSEHTGTHFDAPIHWISGRGKDDIASIMPGKLVRSAAVLDFSEHAKHDDDFLLTRSHIEEWCKAHGPLPDGGWLLYRTGWDSHLNDTEAFMNENHWPGVSADCAKWLARETSIIGLGVETVGTDAGQAASFSGRKFPCHWYFQGANKYGITQLQNLAKLPPQGSLVITAPLPIVGGTGSPSRILALVENELCAKQAA